MFSITNSSIQFAIEFSIFLIIFYPFLDVQQEVIGHMLLHHPVSSELGVNQLTSNLHLKTSRVSWNLIFGDVCPRVGSQYQRSDEIDVHDIPSGSAVVDTDLEFRMAIKFFFTIRIF